jgi:hypothetical protein
MNQIDASRRARNAAWRFIEEHPELAPHFQLLSEVYDIYYRFIMRGADGLQRYGSES